METDSQGMQRGTEMTEEESRFETMEAFGEEEFKPCLHSLIMSKVRSLANKMDELTALARSQKEYRECSLMCFTETWLH